jgi:DNA-binding IclR family transcriptional regulator
VCLSIAPARKIACSSMQHEVSSGPGGQTVEKALSLLSLVVHSRTPMGLGDLTQASGLDKSGVYRLMRALEARGFIGREANGRRYVPGSGLVALAAIVMDRLEIRQIARPILERISAATTETVTLHVRHQRQRVCVEVIEGRHSVRRVVPLGETLPLYAGLSGQVIVAFLPDGERSDILADAERAGESRHRLLDHLALVRGQGYLAVVGERTHGVGALSVPVFDASGVAAAVTVSGPATRWGQDAMDAQAPLVRRECGVISAALGWVAGEAPTGSGPRVS